MVMHLYIHLGVNFNANVIDKIFVIIIIIINSGPVKIRSIALENVWNNRWNIL
jgi:hypothetical protein